MTLGVYVERCDGAVDAVVDLDVALADARTRARVVRVIGDVFDPGALDAVCKDVQEFGLDAIVVAGHSSERYTHSISGGHLQQTLVECGVNPNRVVIANLLEQVALVHHDDAAGATQKARAAVNMAVLRAEMGEALVGMDVHPRQSVLILGMTSEAVIAAQRLLRLGFEVHIADRDSATARAAAATSLRATASLVASHPKAHIYDDALVVDGSGWLGDFGISLDTSSGRVDLEVGGILLARPDVAEWIAELRHHFKIDIDDAGRARSIDPTTHPAETVDSGIMVVPVRESSDPMRAKVASADSAAMALALRLSSETVTHYADVSAVDDTLCGGCASCVKTCAFAACSIGPDGLSHVDIRRCQGCGKCVVSCPQGARDIVNSPHDFLMQAIRDLATYDTTGSNVIGFLCGGCGYPAGDSAGRLARETGDTYPASFLPVRIPCGGRLDALYVLEAFRQGFDGVAVFRCREGHCHNLIGNLDMDRRINLLRTVIRSRGIDDSRLRIVDISPFEGDVFISAVKGVYDAINCLEPAEGGAQ